jgi:crossover junction endodeoxyribonuclease RuvC
VIVLGVDPGTAATGYGVVERRAGELRALDYGCLETSPDRGLPERLVAIHTLVRDLIARYQPALMGVERLFFSRNAQTAFAVGQARGAVLLAAGEAAVPVRDATPNEVKSAVAGYGAADKSQVQRMVQLVLGLNDLPTPDDAADALAVAICVANRERVGAQPGEEPGAPVLDRAAVGPIERGESPFDRAVREALARERSTGSGR